MRCGAGGRDRASSDRGLRARPLHQLMNVAHPGSLDLLYGVERNGLCGLRSEERARRTAYPLFAGTRDLRPSCSIRGRHWLLEPCGKKELPPFRFVALRADVEHRGAWTPMRGAWRRACRSITTVNLCLWHPLWCWWRGCCRQRRGTVLPRRGTFHCHEGEHTTADRSHLAQSLQHSRYSTKAVASLLHCKWANQAYTEKWQSERKIYFDPHR